MKQTSARSMSVTVGVIALSGVLGALVLARSQGPSAAHWVTAWGSSLQGLAPSTTLSNATVRMIARVTIPGDAVRVRIDNSFGTKPLRISRASIGQRNNSDGHAH